MPGGGAAGGVVRTDRRVRPPRADVFSGAPGRASLKQGRSHATRLRRPGLAGAAAAGPRCFDAAYARPLITRRPAPRSLATASRAPYGDGCPAPRPHSDAGVSLAVPHDLGTRLARPEIPCPRSSNAQLRRVRSFDNRSCPALFHPPGGIPYELARDVGFVASPDPYGLPHSRGVFLAASKRHDLHEVERITPNTKLINCVQRLKRCTMARPTLRINPAVLKWAITRSGWDSKELSEKTGIKSDVIETWQRQSASIKLSELRAISRNIKRPLTVLMLPEPPDEQDMPDYRKFGGGEASMSKKTFEVIRNARYVQSVALDMLKLRADEVRPDVKFRSMDDDHEAVAKAERERLDVSLEKDKKGGMDKFARDKYKELKEKIELRNIHVMQDGMDVDEVRGFTLSGGYPKVILINSKDEERPRLFTLLHEYAHLLLKSNGVCMPNSPVFQTPKGRDQLLERWCNNFAGAYMMPKDEILEFAGDKNEEPQKVVRSLARKFCASKTAIAVRMWNLLDAGPHRDGYMEYYNAIASKPAAKRGGGGAGGRDMARECLNRNGRRYVRLVFDSKSRGLITTSEMTKYLSLKTKHFEKLSAYSYET